MKALLFQVGDHLCRIREARGGKAVVAAPVVLEPSGVDVDHIGGQVRLAQLGGDGANLLLGEVTDAAHPQPK